MTHQTVSHYTVNADFKSASEAWKPVETGKGEPTAQQQALMDKVAQAQADGHKSFLSAMAYIEQTWPGFLPENVENETEGGQNKTELYFAFLCLDRQREREAMARASRELSQFRPGCNVGRVALNDGRTVRRAIIQSVSDDGRTFKLGGTLGSRRYTITMSARTFNAGLRQANDGSLWPVAQANNVVPSPDDFALSMA